MEVVLLHSKVEEEESYRPSSWHLSHRARDLGYAGDGKLTNVELSAVASMMSPSIMRWDLVVWRGSQPSSLYK